MNNFLQYRFLLCAGILSGVAFIDAPDVHAQWVQQVSGSTKSLMEVSVVTPAIQFAVGLSGTILKTSTAGSTWIALAAGTSVTQDFHSVAFPTKDDGWIVGGSNNTGIILHTTDGGTSWVQQAAASNILNDVYFMNTQTGFAVGTYGLILRTTDGGTTWVEETVDSISANAFNSINSVYFPTPTTGYCAGSATVLKTIDGGATWKRIMTPNEILTSVHFRDSLRGYIVGTSGFIMKTTDGGVEWLAQSAGSTNDLQSVYCVNDSDAYIASVVGTGGTRMLLRTTNGGVQWKAVQLSGVTTSLWSVKFLSDTLGVAVGESGTIIRYNKPTVSISEEEPRLSLPGLAILGVYPAPANNLTTLELFSPESAHATVTLVSTLGSECARIETDFLSGQNRITLSLANFAAGFYVCRIEAGSESSVQPIIIYH